MLSGGLVKEGSQGQEERGEGQELMQVRGRRGARQLKAAGVLALKEVQGQKKGGEGQEEPQQIKGGRNLTL